MSTDQFQSHDYYLMDELLTDEHKLIRDTARAWVKKEVSPIIEDYYERAEFPNQILPGLAEIGGFGPYMVTPSEVGDYTKLPIELRLNGNVMQKATLADLIFPIPRLISYISEFTALSSGDVIVTGTPGGVGDKRNPPVYMVPGDVVEVDIGLLGVLKNPIVAAPKL